MVYADAQTQTTWAGLTRSDIVRPEILYSAPDTNTPPDEMLTQKPQSPSMLASPTKRHIARHAPTATSGPSLFERRQNAALLGGIALPVADLDPQAPQSPPPTNALLSPLPAANRMYAGHTPLLPGSQSPAQTDEPPATDELIVEDDGLPSPEDDPGLKGPLSLPTNPVDGAEDHIILHNLDEELEKIVRDQDRFSRLKDAPAPSPKAAQENATEGLPLSRKASADSRTSNVEYVNGIPMKSPPLNFGAPLGQLKPN